MEDKIFQLLVEEDDITWKDIIFNLVKTEQMDPWDINIGLLSKKYIELLKKAKELDFKISGKVVLAAAILLRLKSKRLVGEDLDEFDRLLAGNTVDEDEFYDDLAAMRDASKIPEEERLNLVPRTPQPRKRKVSVYDLVNALEKALEVKKRRIIKSIPTLEVEVPQKTTDIGLVIKQVYNRILDHFLEKKGRKLTFSQLVPSRDKEDKILTFIPLLHLSNSRKIDLEQEAHFGEIDIRLLKKKENPADTAGSAKKPEA
ncbi:segregation/condensation protein A [Candidatus Woesearchaeota archaeon]|nr:segregation/condensation protein A [Candidatus Woesearchaeota archaeon]